MTWLLITYLLALIYLSVYREKLGKANSLRPAWNSFRHGADQYFVFALFRAGNVDSTKDLALVEIWADGVSWLLLGISFLFLAQTLAPERAGKAEVSGEPRVL
jgi:hypothetical protein